MKLVKSICFIFLCSLSATSSASIEDINGAFGLKFGEPVPEEIKCNLMKKHTRDNCFLTPPNPFISFNSYRVSVAKN